jgi:hypothetical protein
MPKIFALNRPTQWTLKKITLISDLKLEIIQQDVKLARASHDNSISFCATIVRQDWPEIASQNI